MNHKRRIMVQFVVINIIESSTSWQNQFPKCSWLDTSSIIQNDYKLKLLKILETQNKKNAFNEIRQLLADNKITDYADLFRLLYDEVDSYGKGHVAECILIIARYELSDSQVVDKEINVMAMIIELLGVIKWKQIVLDLKLL